MPSKKKSKVGIKFDGDKLRFDLIPVVPLEKVAKVYTLGAKKYNDRNWEKGITWGRIFAAMMRHGWKWWRGETYDQEDGQHHLASVAWCAFTLMEYEDTHPELDDRVNKCKFVCRPLTLEDAHFGSANLNKNTEVIINQDGSCTLVVPDVDEELPEIPHQEFSSNNSMLKNPF